MNDSRSTLLTSVIVSSLISIVVTLLVVWNVKTPLPFIPSLNNSLGTSTSSLQDRSVVDVVKYTTPAVVSITVTKDVRIGQQLPSDFFDLFGGGFFGIGLPQDNSGNGSGVQKQEVAGGSGFLVSAQGLIITNKHVVDDPKAEYTVFTNDGKKHLAKVIAQDPKLDLAFIKIEGLGFPYLNLGDSSSLQVGQTAIAIGNALGEFNNTVSVGVISGLSRSIVAGDYFGKSESLNEVIQTDAAINPGNSGGPLLDLTGRVVGINVAIVSGSQNIGFALPIDSVKSALNSVQKTGAITRPYIGVRYVIITPDIQEKNKLSVDYGALVSKGATASDSAVIPGSPAAKAGIVEGDIILEADGAKIDSANKLSTLIANKKVGDKVMMKVLHQGKEKMVTITLEAYK